MMSSISGSSIGSFLRGPLRICPALLAIWSTDSLCLQRKVGWPTRFSNLRSIGSCFCNTHRMCPNRDACMFQTACTPRIFTTVINILSTFTISSFLACHGITSFTAVFIWPQAVLEAKVLAKTLDSWRNCVNNRLRIGHTRLMHLHLLTVEDNQHVSFAVFHSLLITYFWNVPT